MTTLDAAEKIAATLNAAETGSFAAKVWTKGSKCRVYVKYDGVDCGFIGIGEAKPFSTIGKNGGSIMRVAETAVKLTGRMAEDLTPVVLSSEPVADLAPARPLNENEAQAREDGESWVDQNFVRHYR